MDKFKSESSERGYNARNALKQIEKARLLGDIKVGVPIGRGKLRIELNHVNESLPISWEVKKNDNRILQVCLALQHQEEKVYLVSNDTNIRIKADLCGISSEPFANDRAPKLDMQYTGRKKVWISDTDFDKFCADKYLDISKTMMVEYVVGNDDTVEAVQVEELEPNQFVTLHNTSGGTKLARIDARDKEIVPLLYNNSMPQDVKPKNEGQNFAIEALMSDCPLVILRGEAGTAKTYLSVAAGLQQTMENGKYRKLLVCRPTITMGENLGYLPGTESEKIDPYMRPIFDAINNIYDKKDCVGTEEENGIIQYIKERGIMEMQAVGFLRGRSIQQQYIIIDEAQNLTPTQIKGIVTRAGRDCKIVFCGDPNQIDTPFLDSQNNGLSYLADKMKGSPLCMQVAFAPSECVRSPLAEECINRLK